MSADQIMKLLCQYKWR